MLGSTVKKDNAVDDDDADENNEFYCFHCYVCRSSKTIFAHNWMVKVEARTHIKERRHFWGEHVIATAATATTK